MLDDNLIEKKRQGCIGIGLKFINSGQGTKILLY